MSGKVLETKVKIRKRFLLWVYEIGNPCQKEIEVDTEKNFLGLKSVGNIGVLKDFLLKDAQEYASNQNMPKCFDDLCLHRVEFRVSASLAEPIVIDTDFTYSSCTEKHKSYGDIIFKKPKGYKEPYCPEENFLGV